MFTARNFRFIRFILMVIALISFVFHPSEDTGFIAVFFMLALIEDWLFPQKTNSAKQA